MEMAEDDKNAIPGRTLSSKSISEEPFGSCRFTGVYNLFRR